MFENNAAKTQVQNPPIFREVEVDRLDPNPFQTRAEDKRSVEQLAHSIVQYGLQQPPKVWKKGERFIICYGHQRIAAVKKLGWQLILCRVEENSSYTEESLALDCIAENLHRTDLSAFERARSFARLEESFNYDRSDLAIKLGLGQTAIGRYLSLLKAPPYLLEAFQGMRLPLSICKVLQRLHRTAGEELTKEHLERLKKDQLSRNQLVALAEPYLEGAEKEERSRSDSDGNEMGDHSWFYRKGEEFGLRSLSVRETDGLDPETWEEMSRDLALFFSAAGVKACSWKLGDAGVKVSFEVPAMVP